MQIVVSKEKSKYGEAVFIRVTLEKMDNDLDVRFANRICGEVGFFVDEENLEWLVSELQRHLTKRALDAACTCPKLLNGRDTLCPIHGDHPETPRQ